MSVATLTETPAVSAPTPSFDLQAITPNIGAQVSEIDLGDELDDETIAALRAALVRHKVLVFHDQPMSPAAHVALARRFGELEVHPVFPRHPDHPELVLLGGNAAGKAQENIFHTDVSWRETPSMASLLRCIECPAVGGDTIWVNMVAAFEQLPEELKTQARPAARGARHHAGLRIADDRRGARRAAGDVPAGVHPVVRTHPESGEQILYVNEAFTTHLANFGEVADVRVGFDFKLAEMELLQYLFRQATIPEYQLRVHWRPDTLVIWDNRSTQHYAVQDYFPAVRRMMRATVIGDRPV